MSTGYDDLGPRIDLGDMGREHQDAPAAGAYRQPRPAVEPARTAPVGPRRGGSGLGIVSMILAVLALLLAVYGLWSGPEPQTVPMSSPDVVPGGTPERTAKLEKDVGALMLRLVTLEKELEAVRSKAGSVNKLTELSAQVAALQNKVDGLAVDASVARISQSSRNQPAANPPAETKPQPAEAKTRPAAEAKPQAAEPAEQVDRKKLAYTVRRGDTLFTVAQRYKVSMKDLMRWNDLKSSHVIKIGEKLVIYK